MYLFSATTIELEHTIRPEAIFPFVAAIFLYASMRTLEAAVARAPRDRRVDVFGGAAVFLVCVLYFLRPHAAFLLPFTLVGVSACAVWIKVGVYRTVRILVVPGLLAATLLWLPEHVLSRRDPDAQRFLPATLLFFHLDMISDVMRRDLANPSFARQDLAVRDTLTMLIRAYEEEQADREGKAGASYPTLGFDADALFYGAPGNALAKHFEGDLEGYRRFCFGYFLRAVIADPARYVKKVYRQLRIFYAIRPRPYSTQYTIDVPSQFTASYRALGDPSYFEEIEQHAVSLDYYRALATTPTRRFYGVGARRLSRAAKAWYQRLEYMYVPALGSAMIAAMALGVLRLRGSARDDVVRGTLLLGLAAFVCAGQTFVFLLAPASIHTLEIGRYVWLQYLVIIFSEFLMLWFLAAVVLALTEGIVARAKAEPIVAREKIGNRVNK
jgi:hypothetical protein